MKAIIKRPLITEKSSGIGEYGVYTFEVVKDSTKEDIKKAVEFGFEVKVKSVRTLICRGRSKRTRSGSVPVRYWKKAYVTLKSGQKISLFEGGAE